jgi:hypothetical protein
LEGAEGPAEERVTEVEVATAEFPAVVRRLPLWPRTSSAAAVLEAASWVASGVSG